MIDKDGNLLCDNPKCSPSGDRRKMGFELKGSVKIPCPRCGHLNIFDTEKKVYSSYKLARLDKVI